MINIIVAMDQNKLIGKNNELPWDLRNDMQHFVKKTSGKNIVMGSRTFESVGLLRNRKTFVLSRSGYELPKHDGATVINKVEYFLNKEEEFWVIGGAQVYELFLPHADFMYLTKIHESFEGDTHFPEINWDEWESEYATYHYKNDGHEHDHTIYKYKRKNL